MEREVFFGLGVEGGHDFARTEDEQVIPEGLLGETALAVFVVPCAISEYRGKVHAVHRILGPIPPGPLVLGCEFGCPIFGGCEDLNNVALFVMITVEPTDGLCQFGFRYALQWSFMGAKQRSQDPTKGFVVFSGGQSGGKNGGVAGDSLTVVKIPDLVPSLVV